MLKSPQQPREVAVFWHEEVCLDDRPEGDREEPGPSGMKSPVTGDSTAAKQLMSVSFIVECILNALDEEE